MPDLPAGLDGPDTPRPPLKVLLGQTLRRLLKNTVWQRLTHFYKFIGHPLQTVQVLVVDRKKQHVLLLRTLESKTGYFPVQGLRQGVRWMPPKIGYLADPREDARRELAEEAVATELALDEFCFLHRYREGGHGQFDCRVYAVDADSDRLWLHDENAEGRPVWESYGHAQKVLNETLRTILAQLPPDGTAMTKMDG